MENRTNSQATLVSTHHENTSSYIQPSTNDSPHNSIISNPPAQHQQPQNSSPVARQHRSIIENRSGSQVLPEVRDSSSKQSYRGDAKSDEQLQKKENQENNEIFAESGSQAKVNAIKQTTSEAQMQWIASQLDNYNRPLEHSEEQNEMQEQVFVKIEEVTHVVEQSLPEIRETNKEMSSHKKLRLSYIQRAQGSEEEETQEEISDMIQDKNKYIQKSIIDYCSNSVSKPRNQDIESINGVKVEDQNHQREERQEQSMPQPLDVESIDGVMVKKQNNFDKSREQKPQSLDIQSIDGVMIENNNTSEKSEKSQSVKYEVNIVGCPDETVDNYVKNNDIYGIERSTNPRPQQEVKQEENEDNISKNSMNAVVQNKVAQQKYESANEDEQKCQNQVRNKQDQKQNYEPDQTVILFQIEQNIKGFVQGAKPDATIEEKESIYLYFQREIQDYISLTFLAPFNSIGQKFLEDGTNVINFIQMMTIKNSNNPKMRMYYQLFLIQKLRPYVRKNISELEQYRQILQAPRRQQLTIVPTVQEKNEAKNVQTQIAIKENDDSKQDDVYSMQVHNPSNNAGDTKSFTTSHRKSVPNEQRTQGPVRRIQFQLSSQDGYSNEEIYDQKHSEPLQRAAKPMVSFLTQNKNPPTQTRKTRRKTPNPQVSSKRKPAITNITTQTEQQIMNKRLGTAYTYAQVRDGKTTTLQPVRASLRIHKLTQRKAEENSNSLPPITERQSGSLRRSPRLQEQEAQNNNNNGKRGRKKGSKKSRNKSKAPSPTIQSVPKHEGRQSARKSVRRLTEQQQKSLNDDYIKEHFKQIKFQRQILESIYTPLSKQDEKITQLLNRYRFLDEKQQSVYEQYEQQSQHSCFDTYSAQQIEEISMAANKKKQQITQQIKREKEEVVQQLSDINLPIEIERIVHPNINNHNIFALLELGNQSRKLYKAKYVLTRINLGVYASRRDEEQDLKTINEMVEEEERGNVGWLNTDQGVLKMIEDQVIRRELLRKRKEAGLNTQ